jgi:hypothetical protein
MEQGSENSIQRIEATSDAICVDRMGPEMRQRGNGATETVATIEECINAYVATGSLSKGAEKLGISADHMRKKLKRHCRKHGMFDVRQLLGDLEQGVTQSFLVKLIEKQGYRCAISGAELTPEIASLDHVVPVSKGGEHAVDNVVWVHAEINRMKGQLSIEEFVSWCSKVVRYNR